MQLTLNEDVQYNSTQGTYERFREDICHVISILARNEVLWSCAGGDTEKNAGEPS